MTYYNVLGCFILFYCSMCGGCRP